jgi:general secretion pathway protein A
MYESFFGLTGLPFQPAADRSSLYDAKSQRETLLALHDGLAHGAPAMLVTGETGTGKTTLCRAFVAGLDRSAFDPVVLSPARIERNAWLETWPEGAADAGADAVRTVDLLLPVPDPPPTATLLLVDGAQDLPPGALKALDALLDGATRAERRLHVCLFADPELRVRIDAAEHARLRARIDVDLQLGPLDPEETRGYVEHRLRSAGWNGEPIFQEEAFFDLFACTMGVPRRIDLLCQELMIFAFLARRRIDSLAVRSAAAALQGTSPAVSGEAVRIEPTFGPLPGPELEPRVELPPETRPGPTAAIASGWVKRPEAWMRTRTAPRATVAAQVDIELDLDIDLDVAVEADVDTEPKAETRQDARPDAVAERPPRLGPQTVTLLQAPAAADAQPTPELVADREAQARNEAMVALFASRARATEIAMRRRRWLVLVGVAVLAVGAVAAAYQLYLDQVGMDALARTGVGDVVGNAGGGTSGGGSLLPETVPAASPMLPPSPAPPPAPRPALEGSARPAEAPLDGPEPAEASGDATEPAVLPPLEAAAAAERPAGPATPCTAQAEALGLCVPLPSTVRR